MLNMKRHISDVDISVLNVLLFRCVCDLVTGDSNSSSIQVHMSLCDSVMNIPKHSSLVCTVGLEYLANSSEEEVRKNAEGASVDIEGRQIKW